MRRIVAVHTLQYNKLHCEKLVFNSYSNSSAATCPLDHNGSKTASKPANWDTAKPYNTIPGPKPLPIIGNTWRFLVQRDFVKLSHFLRTNFGDIALMRELINFGDLLFLFNVRDIEWMLRNDGPYPMRDGFKTLHYYRHDLRKDRFGDTMGLLNGQFEKWGTFRTAVNPIMMQPRTSLQYLPILNDIAEEFITYVHKYKNNNLQGEMPSDFIHEINKWAFESIVYIALDTRLGCLGPNPTEKSQLAMKYIKEVMELNFELDFKSTGIIHKTFKTKVWHDYIKYQDFFTDLVLELIEEVDQKMTKNPNKPEHEKSVFEKLVAKDKKIAMVMTLDMLSAGIDTTGKSAGAILYYIAKNKNAQIKLREELLRLLPSKNTPITKEIIQDAKYLRATIKETLRVSPIAHSTVRRTTKEMVLAGYQIPANVIIMMPHIYLSTGIDEHFTNPFEFKPERWIRGDNQETVNPFVYLPFGFGARSCIGKRMANMELELFTAKMVRNFYIDWPHKDMTFKQELTYGIVDPLKVHLSDVHK